MEYYGNNDWRDYLAHYGRKGMKKGKHLPGTSWWKILTGDKSTSKEAYRTDNEHDVTKLRNTAQYWGTEAERTKNELNKHRGVLGSGNDSQSRTLANQYNKQKDMSNIANSELNRARRENAAARKRKSDKEKEAKKKRTKYVFGIPITTTEPKKKKTNSFGIQHYSTKAPEQPKKKSDTTNNFKKPNRKDFKSKTYSL